MALKTKFYKMRLVNRQRTLFNDYSYSDQWHLLAKAMDDDVRKHRTLKFVHPKDKGKEYIRHYYSKPVNGHTLLALGQYKNEMDFTYVWVVLRPTYFKEPYLVLGNNSRSVRNPDLLADMVASAFNWVLKDSGVELVMEPWDRHGIPKRNAICGTKTFPIRMRTKPIMSSAVILRISAMRMRWSW